jgi:putative two-component system response regulator
LQIAASAQKPVVILPGVMMPGTDGYDLLVRLRVSPPARDIPIMVVTRSESPEDEEREFEPVAMEHITIRALTELAEARDPGDGSHIRRTQDYVRILAGRLQAHPRFAAVLPDKAVKTLVNSAVLHDIGKVGIPDYILSKPGMLTSEEWTIMKTHSLVGAMAIKRARRDADCSIGFVDMAQQVAHFHHERWDGSGYPEGLKSNAIPIPARLMALADMFDALTSRRAYQPPRSIKQARDIIVGQRGHHFDPDVVDAFLAGFADFAAVAKGIGHPR